MDKKEFLAKIRGITDYTEFRKLIIDSNMPNVAAVEFNLSKELFRKFVRRIEHIDIDVKQFIADFDQIYELHKEKVEAPQVITSSQTKRNNNHEYYNFDYYENFEDEYDQIISSDDPKNIEDVSMLRHYINCHGITKKLLKYLEITEDELEDVCKLCKGTVSIFDIMDNAQKCINDAAERISRREDAEYKNHCLILEFNKAKDDFCGIGMRKTKLSLNRIIKKGNLLAKLLRSALEIEDVNIRAKDTFGQYKDRIYKKKSELMNNFFNLCLENGITCGVQKSDNYSASYVCYVEIPRTEQISWHSTGGDYIKKLPEYKNEWDGKVNSTLPKLEKAILELFKRYKDIVMDNDRLKN